MNARHSVAILGAGKIGRGITRLLEKSGHYDVVVADASAEALAQLAAETPVATRAVDVRDPVAVAALLADRQSVVSACPFECNTAIAQAALHAGASYFDLTEDVATTAAIRLVANDAIEGQVFMPQCGLAPGYIGILARDLCRRFDRLERVTMRVGALPLYPTNMLKYNLTWSTDGLINEYCNPCEAIRDRRRVLLEPLEGLEHFALDGVDYEAFNTSGGLGTLCETLEGEVVDLDYKTVRYDGHRYLMAFLLHGLQFSERRSMLKEVMEAAIPCTHQDVVLAFCTVTGWRQGRYEQISDARKIYHGEIHGLPASSIQITTASSLCTVLDLHRQCRLGQCRLAAGLPEQRGFVRQEDVRLDEFLANPFAEPFAAATPVRTPVPRRLEATA
jgi:saccharopine dehydrogenase-like NADP-dependent oxidoreductase